MKRWKVVISNWLLKHLFCAYSIDDILRIEWIDSQNGIAALYVGKDKIPLNEASNIAKELQVIRRLPSFRRVLESMKGDANNKMFVKSQVIDDLVFSKAMLYNIDVLERLIDNVSRITEIR